MIGPELVQETSDKIQLIRKRLVAAQDRQKSYADNRRKDLQFEVSGHVFLKVSPTRGVTPLLDPVQLHQLTLDLVEVLQWNESNNFQYRLKYTQITIQFQ